MKTHSNDSLMTPSFLEKIIVSKKDEFSLFISLCLNRPPHWLRFQKKKGPFSFLLKHKELFQGPIGDMGRFYKGQFTLRLDLYEGGTERKEGMGKEVEAEKQKKNLLYTRIIS